MVAREQQPAAGVVEHDVAAGVPRRGHHVQAAVAVRDDLAVVQPVVRHFPARLVRVPGTLQLGHPVGQLTGTEQAQVFELVLQRGPVPAHGTRQRFPVPDAQADRGAELAPQVDGLGVVVPVHVRDQDPADVPGGAAQLVQALVEQGPGPGDRPPGVDEDQVTAVHQRVDVDRAQPVVRERKRDPVDAGHDLERAGLSPGVRVEVSGCTRGILPGRSLGSQLAAEGPELAQAVGLAGAAAAGSSSARFTGTSIRLPVSVRGMTAIWRTRSGWCRGESWSRSRPPDAGDGLSSKAGRRPENQRLR